MKLQNAMFGVIAAIGILGGMGWGIKNYIFYQKSVPVVGTVISVAHNSYYDTRSHSMRYYDYPLIQFTANDGKKYKFYGTASINMTGYDVDVLYQKDDPSKASENSLIIWLYPLVVFFVGLIFMYVTYVNVNAGRQIKREMAEDAKDLEDD